MGSLDSDRFLQHRESLVRISQMRIHMSQDGSFHFDIREEASGAAVDDQGNMFIFLYVALVDIDSKTPEIAPRSTSSGRTASGSFRSAPASATIWRSTSTVGSPAASFPPLQRTRRLAAIHSKGGQDFQG